MSPVRSCKEVSQTRKCWNKKQVTSSIPSTPEAIDKSNNKLLCLLQCSHALQDQLNDPKEAAIMFEELLNVFLIAN